MHGFVDLQNNALFSSYAYSLALNGMPFQRSAYSKTCLWSVATLYLYSS